KPKNQSVPYHNIHMPKDTAMGFVIGILAFIFAFAMVWHIWWLAIVGLVASIGAIIVRSFNYNIDYYVPVKEVERIELKHQQEMTMVKP
ncbi:MAG: cytochrome o ubiquinol oxidase subunit I, partial [Gammaproteobacteria bacterium]|nr:cytochrome o ubiquinol oxidase subunit I [Gammaproteobacteria bacterium]